MKKNVIAGICALILTGSYLYINATIPSPQIMLREDISAKRAVGKALTNVKLPDMKGHMCNLTDFIGKGKKHVVLIDFWATWCGPCMREMPNVKAAYDKYHKKGFDVVGISFDNDATRWKTTVKENGWKWHHLSDLKGWKCAAGKMYNINSIPSSILVDGNGKIIANDLRGEALNEKLRSIYGF
ncbi:MAG: TlpA family protein disulfide reductase [Prevotella sp.]|nr:TlpA family protein disulfide reductase [Candidatus Equicola faecalis]